MTKFNVKFSDSTYQAVGQLARWTDGTMADVIREALSVFWWIAKEYGQGHRLLIQRGDQVTELLIPSLERLKADAPFVEAQFVSVTVDDASFEPEDHQEGRRRANAKG